MKIVIIGLGSIGTRHAKLLMERRDCELVALRSGPGPRNALGIPEYFSWADVKKFKPSVAFIATPTHMHLPWAQRCAEAGMHLFIEKPLGHTVEGVDQIKRICDDKKLTAYVAYVLPLHPVITQVKTLLRDKIVFHVRAISSSYLPAWRPGREHCAYYSAHRDQGGGVLLDLSHEMDYLSYLFGPLKSLGGWSGRLSEVTVDSEDCCCLEAQFGKNLLAEIHLDYFSRVPERTLRADFKGGTVYGDLLGKRIKYVSDQGEEEFIFTETMEDVFRKQLNYFFENISNPYIMNNLKDANYLLRKILEFRDGNIEHTADGRGPRRV